MTDAQFDPMQELAAVKERRALQKRRQYRKSKLEKYRAELVALDQAGASAQDLATWLKMKHRLKIHRASVARYLATLPELRTDAATGDPITTSGPATPAEFAPEGICAFVS
jgi:hypothetical protein